mmetsp:Transcript_14542/g.42597  ORF Transcript_14542/g.42597 Transcript_14542/m.42597 type:complete len:208 (-) Transcript_14542:498-1121(-)
MRPPHRAAVAMSLLVASLFFLFDGFQAQRKDDRGLSGELPMMAVCGEKSLVRCVICFLFWHSSAVLLGSSLRPPKTDFDSFVQEHIIGGSFVAVWNTRRTKASCTRSDVAKNRENRAGTRDALAFGPRPISERKTTNAIAPKHTRTPNLSAPRKERGFALSPSCSIAAQAVPAAGTIGNWSGLRHSHLSYTVEQKPKATLRYQMALL